MLWVGARLGFDLGWYGALAHEFPILGHHLKLLVAELFVSDFPEATSAAQLFFALHLASAGLAVIGRVDLGETYLDLLLHWRELAFGMLPDKFVDGSGWSGEFGDAFGHFYNLWRNLSKWQVYRMF